MKSETFLNDVFRARFAQEVNAFEECEKLMEKYDSKVKNQIKGGNDKVEDVMGPEERSIVLGNLGGDIPSHESSVASTRGHRSMSSTDTVAAPREVTPLTTPDSASSRSSRESFIRKIFRQRKNNHHNMSRTNAAEQIQATSNDTEEDLKKFRESQKQKQEQSTFFERVHWVVGERKRFVELLEELTAHNDYFVSILGLQKNVQQTVRTSSRSPSISTRTANAASHLRRLIRSLGATRASNRLFFQLMLIDDPFELRSRIGDDLPEHALLRQASSMFALKILKSPSTVPSAAANNESNIVSCLFEVPSTSHTSDDVEEQIKAERSQIESFSTECFLAENAPNEVKPDAWSWWAALGTIKDVSKSTKLISVFHDRSKYMQSKSLYQSFVDSVESKVAENTYLIYRVRLAFVLASSFTHFVCAGYPLDYLSNSLRYYTDSNTQPASSDIRELAQSRMCPYIQLRAIGATPPSKSFSSILGGAIETVRKDQIMVHRLGVLLCEVGRWKPASSAEDWRSLSSAARIRKVDLLKCATVGYFNVVHACLEFSPPEVWTTDDQVAWLDDIVVQPLRNILESLPSEFRLT